MSSDSDFLGEVSDQRYAFLNCSKPPVEAQLWSNPSAPSQPAGADGVTHACAHEGPNQFSINDQQPWKARHEGTSIWTSASRDDFSAFLATPGYFQAPPDSLDTPLSASGAWNFDHSALNFNNYPLWNQRSGDDFPMDIPDGQGKMPLLTSDPVFPPASPEAQFDFTLDTVPPQLDLAPPLATRFSPASAPAPRITCSVDGCGRSFVRAGDCRRHMLKHGPPKFKCTIIECDMTFHRADKLRAHMKQGHKIRL